MTRPQPSNSAATATGAVARFAANTRYDDLTPDLVRIGKRHILDGIGLLVAGTRSETSVVVGQYAGSFETSDGAHVWGRALRVPPRFAALANAATLHADDFDDTNQPTGGAAKTGGIHTTAVILPTVLALCEARRLGGRDLITAFHVGSEVACKLNDAINPRHYEAGFHSTGTIGALGAAAAAANLVGLSTGQTETALGAAASFASGLRENFGTMTKPLHAGRAGESGIAAVDLTALGLTAADGILDAERGFFAAYADGFDISRIVGRLGQPWALQDPGSLMKAYASGAVSHAAMSLLEDMLAEHGFSADDVDEIVVSTQPKIKNILLHPYPNDALEAKFSMPFALAVLLVHGRAGLGEFTDKVVASSAIRATLPKIRHETYEPQKDYGNFTSFIEVRLTDGRVLAGRADHGKGSPHRPLTDEDIVHKFLGGAAHAALPEDRARSLLALVERLEDLEDVNQLQEAAGI